MRFDAIAAADLRAVGGTKWRKHPGAIGAFIAEMDFGVAPQVSRALRRAVDTSMLGYLPPWLDHDVSAATSEWLEERYDWRVPADDIVPTSDVLKIYEFALRFLLPPAAKVILMTPAYGPFFGLARLTGRDVIEVPMTAEDGGWITDLEAIAAAFRDGGGLLVLCNPHNPLGKVYSSAELRAIAEVVEAHGGRVFADEIHAPIVYDGHRHVPYASVSEAAASHGVTATSASKGFNLSGVMCGQAIVTNDGDRAVFARLRDYLVHGCSGLGAVATVAAYREGQPWLLEVTGYLDENRRFAADMLARLAPEIGVTLPQGTYLTWLDVREAGFGADPKQFLLDHANVALSDGAAFGAVGRGHVRLNLAMPRPLLREAIEAVAGAITPRVAGPH